MGIRVKNRNIMIFYGAIALAILIIIVLIIIPKNKELSTEEKSYISTCKIRDMDDSWEVRIEFPAGQKILYKNGEKQEVLQVLSIKDAEPHMELPIVTKAKDLDELKNKHAITWESTLEDSACYVKYLIDNGYKEIRYAATQNYIEMYLQNSENIKRLLISKESIMVADVLDNNLPDIKYYYQ